MMVSDGLTAEIDGMNEASATYKLSMSWLRQDASNTDCVGIVAKAQGTRLMRHGADVHALKEHHRETQAHEAPISIAPASRRCSASLFGR